jgi:hypothetical protein
MRIYGYLASLSVTEKMVVGQISPSPPDILQAREFLSDSSTNVSTLRLHEFLNSRWFFFEPCHPLAYPLHHKKNNVSICSASSLPFWESQLQKSA